MNAAMQTGSAQETMRAVLTRAHGDRTNLDYVQSFPKPRPSSEQVLIRVAATALNHHDIFTRRGMPGIKIPLPVITGSDVAGEIVALGADVTGWAVGDRVLVDPVCYRSPKPGLVGEICHGGRAEYMAVDHTQLVRVPEGVTFEAAAALPLAYGTAYRMLTTRGQVRAGETVLVLGASGGVGVACVQIAKMLGATVIACASTQSKIERLQALGADHVINTREADFSAETIKLMGKPHLFGETGGVHVAVNFTGADTFAATQKCVRRGGRILVCGATGGFKLNADARYLWTFEHTIIGSNGWQKEDLGSLLELIRTGKLEPVIDRILPLSEAAEAERLMEDREVFGKILLRP